MLRKRPKVFISVLIVIVLKVFPDIRMNLVNDEAFQSFFQIDRASLHVLLVKFFWRTQSRRDRSRPFCILSRIDKSVSIFSTRSKNSTPITNTSSLNDIWIKVVPMLFLVPQIPLRVQYSFRNHCCFESKSLTIRQVLLF